MDDPLPLDFGFLEDGKAGGSKIIETLRHMFFGEAVDTLQFDDQYIFDENISKVISHVMALVPDCKGSLGCRSDTLNGEFSNERTLVDLFEKSGSKGIRDLKDGAKHTLGQRIESAFIRVHRRPILCVLLGQYLSELLLAAD